MDLHADFLELEMPELAEYLLRETGQVGNTPTNPSDLLGFLKLQFAMIDIASLLPITSCRTKQPRGVLSYPDQIIGVDLSLRSSVQRARFTTMHEIGHYVLPNHRNDLYICDEQGMSHEARIITEMEANAFAAELLFKGDMFTRQANDCPITPESIKTLAQLYDTSFEATAHRFVERNAGACSLTVFIQAPGYGVIDTNRPGRWQQSYTISSADFRTQYFCQLRGEVPEDVVRKLWVPGRDFADSIDEEVPISTAVEDKNRFRVSFFTNHHCIFGLIQPTAKGGK
jgi:hypothetical protein